MFSRTGASASSASNNDSKKKYPRDLHDIKTKDELLSLIAWVNFVEKERKEFLKNEVKTEVKNEVNSNNGVSQAFWNNRNSLGYTFEERELRKKTASRSLTKKFKNIPTSTVEERSNLNFLINFIINNPHDGLGRYEDETYFEDIKKYAVKMKTEHPEWEPTESNSNEDNTNWHIIKNE
jgi:hypothetical protein